MTACVNTSARQTTFVGPTGAKTSGGTIQVLGHDDSASLNAICAVASEIGAIVETCSGLESLLKRKDLPRPGCLIAGSRLSGASLTELPLAVEQFRDPLPLICVYETMGVATAVQLMEQGAVTLMQRPLDQDALKKTLCSVFKWDAQWMATRKRFDELRRCEMSLTDRERIVLSYLVQGYPNKAIARELDLSVRMIETHRAQILVKFGTRTAQEVTAKSAELRVLEETRYGVGSAAELNVPAMSDRRSALRQFE